MNHIAEYLPDYERLNGIRYGAAMELADRGITVGQFDAVVKQAQAKVPTISLSDVLKTAVIAGVPAGVLWYALRSSIEKGDRKTRKLQSELDYYNQVAHEMKNRLKYDTRSGSSYEGLS